MKNNDRDAQVLNVPLKYRSMIFHNLDMKGNSFWHFKGNLHLSCISNVEHHSHLIRNLICFCEKEKFINCARSSFWILDRLYEKKDSY